MSHSLCQRIHIMTYTVTGQQELISLYKTTDQIEFCLTEPSKKYI